MDSFLVPDKLSQFFKKYPAGSYLVAYSGGLDSHVLLHACSLLRDEQSDFNVRAIHIDHGLQVESTAWAQHCQQVCSELSVPLHTELLHLQVQAGASLESEARNARLKAFAEHLTKGEILLTAHHQDDQAETLLLNLLRGAGVAGLAAMPESRAFQQTLLCRPLLGISRQQLVAYARYHQLAWIEDPSNQSTVFDRNFLRHEIMPRLQERWPATSALLSRAALWQSESQDVQVFFLEKELSQIGGEQADTLSVVKLLAYPTALQKALLRQWLKQRGFIPPSAKKLWHVLNDVLLARPDAKPCVSWQGCEIHRYRGDLYAVAPVSGHDPQQVLSWCDLERPLLIDSLGISLRPDSFTELLPLLAGSERALTVRFRCGGEKLLSGQGHHISLKHWFQEQGIPPWERNRIPLIYAGRQLIAIPGRYTLHVSNFVAD